MKEIKITIGGKEYAKSNVRIADWLALVEFTEKYKEKNILLDKEAGLAAMDVLAGYLGVQEKEMRAESDLAEIMQAWRDLNANVVEAFTGVETGKNAGGRAGRTAK